MRIGTCLGGGPGGGGFFLGIFEGLGSAGTWSMSSLTRSGMVTVRNVKKLNRYVGFGRFFGGGNYAKKRQDLPLAGSWDKASIQSKGWIVKLIALCSRRGKMDQIQ